MAGVAVIACRGCLSMSVVRKPADSACLCSCQAESRKMVSLIESNLEQDSTTGSARLAAALAARRMARSRSLGSFSSSSAVA